jgi:hypothetical protein
MTQVDTLVILDRAVDLLSTLPTQLTYEGDDRNILMQIYTASVPDPYVFVRSGSGLSLKNDVNVPYRYLQKRISIK